MPDKPKAGETRKQFIARAIAYFIGEENLPHNVATARAYDMWNSHITKKEGKK